MSGNSASAGLRGFTGGCRYSLVTLVWTVVGFFLVAAHIISMYSRKYHQVSSYQLRVHHRLHHNDQLVRVKEEILQQRISPPRKLSPLVEELVHEKFSIRHLFSPGMKSTAAFGPTKTMGSETSYYFPGKIWMDTEGNPIQAHGGGVLLDEKSNTYYWYGEYKDGPTYRAHDKKGQIRVDIIGVGCYSSKDLWAWKNEGIVLRAEETNKTHDLHKSNVLERPKVIYNEKTEKYVMWMHIDNAKYTKASVGVATSDKPTGPFEYLYSKRPHGFDSRDMTVFKDDDNVAYLIYSSEVNSVIHIGPLTEDYLDVTHVMKRFMVGQQREAPVIFKHENTYYMITSGCTAWAPNEALVHAAESMMGPWEKLGNPCFGGNKALRLTTFFSQSTFVFPLPGVPDAFIFMADRWNPSDLRDSRYVWLPLLIGGSADQPLEFNFGFPMWSRVSIYWHSKWRLPN